jgi:PAS domain S-box-containing protein
LEDSRLDAELILGVLEGEGFRVQFDVADSADTFRERLEKAEYDVILADFNLRSWTAFDALEIVRRSGRDIPLVVLTGAVDDEAGAECLMQGAADYVLKDRPARLPHAVQQVLEEKRLRTSNQRALEATSRLATIVESSDDAIIGKTLDGVITSWNRGAEELYGYAAAEVLGQPISMLVPPARSEELAPTLARLRRGERVEHFESVRVRKDGSLGDVSLSMFPLTGAGGDVIGAASIARYITERKRAEQTLRGSEERFRSLVENATVGIYRTTPQGQILMANPTLVRMLGFKDFEELAARNLEEDGFVPNYARRLFRERMEKDGEVRGVEEAWTRQDGSAIFVRESARAIRSEDGKILYYDGIVEDITEKKKAEEALRLTQFSVEHASDSIFWMDKQGRILYVNEAACHSLARKIHVF